MTSSEHKPHREQVTVTHMDLIEHRLSTTTDKPNGTAWFNAYQIDVRHLVEQYGGCQEALETMAALVQDKYAEIKGLEEQLEITDKQRLKWERLAMDRGFALEGTQEQLETLQQERDFALREQAFARSQWEAWSQDFDKLKEQYQSALEFIQAVADGDFGLGTMAARNAQEFLDSIPASGGAGLPDPSDLSRAPVAGVPPPEKSSTYFGDGPTMTVDEYEDGSFTVETHGSNPAMRPGHDPSCTDENRCCEDGPLVYPKVEES